MNVFLCILIGFIIGVVFSIGCLFTYLRLKKIFGSPRWYPVARFNYVPEADGVYHMDFYLGEAVLVGYTKKCPPPDTKPEELEIKIRTLHPVRCRYRVYWRFKTDVD